MKIYNGDNITIYNSDCLDMFKNMGNNSVDLIITDPPYGVEFANNKEYDDSKETVFNQYELWLKEMHRVLKEESHIYIFIPTLEIDRWVSKVKEIFKFNNLLAFQTHNTNRYLKNNFGFDLQLVIYASKGKAKRLNKVDWIPTSESWLKDKRNKVKNPYTYKYPSFIKYIKANEKNNAFKKSFHGNIKNLELIKKFILLSSNENDLIIDPFLGSGTTAIAAKQTNRKFIGSEKNEKFFKLIIERLEKEN